MSTGKTLDKVMAYAARAHARRVLNRLLNATQEATLLQERVLLEHIRRNAASDYGNDHGFDFIANYADFARQVPISTYQDLDPYIQRVKKGELSAMFGPGQRVHMFALTSGTTDQPKYIPVTDRFLADYRRGWNAFGVKALIDHPSALLKPIVQVTSPMDETTTSAGIPCGAITGLMAATQKRIVRRYYATPPCVAYIKQADARYYTVARLAMAGPVGFMITANPATHLRIARLADQYAERLIDDIRQGTLTPPGDVPQTVLTALGPALQPDPQRAAYLHQIAQRTGRLLPKDVWDLGFIANWTGGTMGLYLQDFPEYFGSVPVRDIGLLASEGRMSIPIVDHTPAGILEITTNFFEFIPADQADAANPPVLRSHQLEIGQEYLILLTNAAGFYRYNIQDQIKVVDYLGQAPMIEFLHRGTQVASLAGEKLTEQQTVRALQRTCDSQDVAIRTFVLAARWDRPPFYRLHVEATDCLNLSCAERLAAELDKQLRTANIEYASKQDSGRLGPVRVNLLPRGFFAKLEAQATAQRRGRHEQYKHRFLYPTPGQDAEFPLAVADMPAIAQPRSIGPGRISRPV